MNNPPREVLLKPVWAVALAAVLSVLAVLVYHETALDMYSIWMRSGTFTHALLVAPISIWLMWEKRAHLVHSGFKPALLPLLCVAGSGVLWILGEAVSGAVVSHYALTFMIIALVWSVWGHRAAWCAVFPLAFLLFAVPFGEFMVPTLMQYTAKFTVGLLRLSGIPVYQEGMSFVIPSGRWSVVEACSGIRYLIASFMVGVLFAYLNYRSWRRRLYFVLASLIVPLIANWMRAYIIVMMGHLSGNVLAVGADHLIYGWVFFGLVIGILFWVGGRWREPEAPEPVQDVQGGKQGALPDARTIGIVVAALALMVLPRPIYSWLIDLPAAQAYEIPNITPAASWQVGPLRPPSWRALTEGQITNSSQSFVRDGKIVYVQISYFAKQSAGHELVQYANRFTDPQDETWGLIESHGVQLDAGQGSVSFDQALITGDTGRLVAVRTNWLGEKSTASDREAKLDLLKSRLTRKPDDSAFVVIWTPTGEITTEAEQTLAQFVRDNWTAIDAALQRTARR